MDDLEHKVRFARDKDGKPIQVPSSMKYPEWKEKYLGENSAEKVQKSAENSNDTNKNKKLNDADKSDTVKPDRPRRGQFDSYKDKKTALKMLQEETGYTIEEANKVQKSMDLYFSNDYTEFTAGNRKGDVKIIDDALQRMAVYDGEIQRGMHLVPMDYEELIESAVEGAELKMKSISSWSSEKSVADRFADLSESQNSVIIKCIKNKSGVGVQHISVVGSRESEVLAPSSARYKIISVESTVKQGKTWKLIDGKMQEVTINKQCYDYRTRGYADSHTTIITVEEI